MDFGLACCNVLIIDNSIDFYTETSILFVVLVVVVWRRPFIEWYKNVGLSLILLSSILSNVSSYLNQETTVATVVADALSYSMLALVGVFVAGLVAVILVYGCVARCVRLPRVLRINQYAVFRLFLCFFPL